MQRATGRVWAKAWAAESALASELVLVLETMLAVSVSQARTDDATCSVLCRYSQPHSSVPHCSGLHKIDGVLRNLVKARGWAWALVKAWAWE